MTTTAPVVAVHPERTDDARTVRWYTPAGMGTHAGGPRHGPADGCALPSLVRAGVLAAAGVAGRSLVTTLAPGRSWDVDGATVRAAVQACLRHCRSGGSGGQVLLEGEVPRDEQMLLHDDVLRARVLRVLRSAVIPYAAGHGGGVELVGVAEGVVDVRMVGACRGCPAAGWTVQARLLDALLAQDPGVVVRVVDAAG